MPEITAHPDLVLSNTCTCEDEQGLPSECGGGCWVDAVDDLAVLVAQWIRRHHAEHGYLIQGENMGWRRLSGVSWWSGEQPLYEVLSVRTEWTQRYWFSEDMIVVEQSHHDAPHGETYTIWVATEVEANLLAH